MSHLLDLFEQQVSGERRAGYHEGVTRVSRPLLCRPRQAARRRDQRQHAAGERARSGVVRVDGHEGPAHGRADRGGRGQEHDRPLLPDAGARRHRPDKYREQIAKNAERILSLQRPDGQWAARFEATQPEVEFQTGTRCGRCTPAGIPATNPQVAKSLQYLLARQQPFGGWMDPLQSYENFRTPFRETQMAVLALSSYFPPTGRREGLERPDGRAALDRPGRGARAARRRLGRAAAGVAQADRGRGAVERRAGPPGGGGGARTPRRVPRHEAAGRPEQAGAAHRRVGAAAGLQPPPGDCRRAT